MERNKIKVGFIADDIDRPAMGTALYMQKLIEQYVTTFKDEVELVLIYREGNCRLPISSVARHLPIKVLKLLKFSGFFSFLRFFLTSKEEFDIVHFPRPKLFPFFWKLRSKKFVVTFHDAPEEGSVRFRTWHNYAFEWFIKLWGKRHIDAAIGDTEFAAENIARYFDIDESKAYGIKLAGSVGFKPLDHDEVEKKKELIEEKYGIRTPYILQVARLVPHKNVHRAVQAFNILKKSGNYPHRLVILGGRGHASEYDKLVDAAIDEANSPDDVYLAPYVETEDLSAVYSLADISAQVSLSEGFGIPVVDSFNAGVPVICSTTSVFPEVAGKAAVLVDPFDPASIATGMKSLLDSESLRKEKSALGLVRGREYSWKKVAKETIDVYRKILV